jgi:hypothetical protein
MHFTNQLTDFWAMLYIFKKEHEGVDQIVLAQDRFQKWAFVDMIIQPSRSISWPAKWLPSFQEGTCSMELYGIETAC